jgi:DNA topoisomerase-1
VVRVKCFQAVDTHANSANHAVLSALSCRPNREHLVCIPHVWIKQGLNSMSDEKKKKQGTAKTKTASEKTPKKAEAKKPAAKKAPAKKVEAKVEPKAEAKEVEAKPKAAAKKAAAKKPATETKAATKKASKKETKPKEIVLADNEEITRESTGKSLVVVESPAKARTIKKYLGPNFYVTASMGHVKDLPKTRMGVDPANNFEAEYEVLDGRGKVLSEIKSAAKGADAVYLAPDPDREGEAIAWHISEELGKIKVPIHRVLFNEITPKAIQAALKSPQKLDPNKFDSHRARRVLDRLVGYEISPILWKKVARGLSAGRVQSVAVRLLVERERAIAVFKPQEYWTIDCSLAAALPPAFPARLTYSNKEKVDIKTEAEARAIEKDLSQQSPIVGNVDVKERQRKPPPPYITSRIQQEASRRFKFSAKRTMKIAQELYEGIDLGEEGPVGLITYMRTDSTRISDDAVATCRAFIEKKYGPTFIPEKPNVFKSKKQAQDAHEAIRPTGVERTPDAVKSFLNADQQKLYQMIWERFVACQMTPAKFEQTGIDIEAGKFTLRANGQKMNFAGWLAVYGEPKKTQDETDGAPQKEEDAEAGDSGDSVDLPALKKGEKLSLKEVKPEQHFTQPPPRYTEGTLVKALEENGIGRPSTYASIISVILEKKYVDKVDSKLKPTELGVIVTDLLTQSFPKIMDTEFTAGMEENLDQIEEGTIEWRKMLGGFYGDFAKTLEEAKVSMRDIKREEIPTDHVCEKCGKPMVIKWGKNGSFLACTGYPDCKNTKEINRDISGAFTIVPQKTTNEICDVCQAPMMVRRGKFGEFLACSRYPECKTTKPISLGVACPRQGCGGQISERRSKRNKSFYGCSNYTKTGCDFVLWDKPIPEVCPDCEAPFLLISKKGAVKCARQGCGYSRDNEASAESSGEGESASAESA